MVILVVFNSFSVVKNSKDPDLVARQKPPFYTTPEEHPFRILDIEICHGVTMDSRDADPKLLCSSGMKRMSSTGFQGFLCRTY